MKYVRNVETFDGKVHATQEEARRHVEAAHGTQLSLIAHNLAACEGRYVALGNWVDENLGLFLELNRIKQDLVMQADTYEED